MSPARNDTTLDAAVTERKRAIHLLLSPAIDRQVRELARRERRPLVVQIELLIERGLNASEAVA